MSEFDHDYYLLDKDLKQTVLCMKCSFPVKSPEYSKEKTKELYNEVKVEWSYGNGIKADGVVITCPGCKDFHFSDEIATKIRRQVIQALELQMKKANKKDEEINHIKNLFSQMKLVGRV